MRNRNYKNYSSLKTGYVWGVESNANGKNKCTELKFVKLSAIQNPKKTYQNGKEYS